MTNAQVFTTFEAAKICGVFHTTVINWVNQGKLRAHTTPGGHRRIAAADLVELMRRFEMPIPPDLRPKPKRVLVVEDDPSVSRMLVRTLSALPGVKVDACVGGLEALMEIGKEAPELLLLDIRIPQVNGVEVCQVLKANEQTRPIKIIAITGEPLKPEAEAYLIEQVEGFFEKPLPTAQLKSLARELLGLEETAPAP